MRHKKTITLNLQNITPNFTGKIKIITLISIIIMLSFANIINTSALSYQSNVGIDFTFNPTLSINISSSDLVISNLVPGSSSDSNIINVSVLTNASHGYALAVDTSSEDLVHSNNINTFSSIATDADLSSLTTDNTWGYSYKLSSSNTWSNYNGLPLHTSTSTTLINTDNQVSKPIDFKIGAKASTAQASGTYTGTINFMAVSKPTPKTIEDIVYMQTFGELVEPDLQSVKDSMEEEHTYILKDARDEQDYTVAKLKDGKIWMTKNLNLAGGTEITSELSDVPANYTLPTANRFQEENKLPESSITGFGNDSKAFIYNTNNNTDDCIDTGCYSYYSWVASTVGSGVDMTTVNTDAPYSICPRGWRLPNSRKTIVGKSDFYQLAIAYGMNPNSVSDSSLETGGNFYSQAGAGSVPNFILSGGYQKGQFTDGGAYGKYASSTVESTNAAFRFNISPSITNSATGNVRQRGIAVRCLAR